MQISPSTGVSSFLLEFVTFVFDLWYHKLWNKVSANITFLASLYQFQCLLWFSFLFSACSSEISLISCHFHLTWFIWFDRWSAIDLSASSSSSFLSLFSMESVFSILCKKVSMNMFTFNHFSLSATFNVSDSFLCFSALVQWDLFNMLLFSSQRDSVKIVNKTYVDQLLRFLNQGEYKQTNLGISLLISMFTMVFFSFQCLSSEISTIYCH